MNATRAATIRLRSSFDGAVSLGRVQTPTLAIIARREEEIRAFVPEPYWLVDATFETVDDPRRYTGRFHAGAQPRLKTADGGRGDRRRRAGRARDDHQAREDQAVREGAAAVRPHVAAARGQHALRVQRAPDAVRGAALLRGAQGPHLSAYELALPADGHDPARSSRSPALLGTQREYARASAYVTGLDVLPLGRVINDAKVTDHHAIIPTNSEHKLDKLSDDDRRIYDMVVRRFLAVFHPDAVFENTRLETVVAEHVFRTRGRVLLEAGLARRLRRGPGGARRRRRRGAPTSSSRSWCRASTSACSRSRADEKITQPPRRYSDASLLGAMETAGKLVDDDELREAMKDSGIGTPATRAAIIERLIDVGYVERDGRSLVCTEKGLGVIRLLDDHALTSPSLTGDWEHRLAKIEEGDESASKFMADIAAFAGATVTTLDEKLKEVRIPRANLGPCPVCGHDIVENRKGFSCWSREDPGCGFVIWKLKAGKTLPARRRPRADRQGPHREGRSPASRAAPAAPSARSSR